MSWQTDLCVERHLLLLDFIDGVLTCEHCWKLKASSSINLKEEFIKFDLLSSEISLWNRNSKTLRCCVLWGWKIKQKEKENSWKFIYTKKSRGKFTICSKTFVTAQINLAQISCFHAKNWSCWKSFVYLILMFIFMKRVSIRFSSSNDDIYCVRH